MTAIRKKLMNLHKEITRPRNTRREEQRYQSDMVKAWELLEHEVFLMEEKLKDKQKG